MRLVDADVADKWMRQNNAFIDAAILKAIPTIDAVPVVRCRECRRFMPYTAEYKAKVEKADGDCGILIFGCTDHQYAARQADDFCSYGQRKIETILPKSDVKDESLEADHEEV